MWIIRTLFQPQAGSRRSCAFLSLSIVVAWVVVWPGDWPWGGWRRDSETGGALGPPPRPCWGADASKRRSLVVVAHGGKTGYNYAQEWSNLDYFIRNGVDTSRSDYVFAIPFLGSEWWPERYTNTSGISFVRTPVPCPCDLCSHAMVLRSIGLEEVMKRYGTCVFFNTGARGPYPPGAGWMDRVEANTLAHPTPRAVGNTVVWEGDCHIPSYFVAFPSCVAGYIQRMWLETCHEEDGGVGGSMGDCATRGEFTLLPFLNWLGVPVHVTSRNLTIWSEEDCAANEPPPVPWFMWGRSTNPDFWPVNLTMSMFLKYGGGIYRSRWIHPSVVREVQRLGG